MSLKFGATLMVATIATSSQFSSAQETYNCPGPLFECVGPGPGGNPPGTPPGTILDVVAPLVGSNVDFNKSFAVIRSKQMTVTKGTLKLTNEAGEFLTNNRHKIEPNAIYTLSPQSFVNPIEGAEMIVIGGGALTQ